MFQSKKSIQPLKRTLGVSSLKSSSLYNDSLRMILPEILSSMPKCLKQGSRNTLENSENTKYGEREVEMRGKERWDVLGWWEKNEPSMVASF